MTDSAQSKQRDAILTAREVAAELRCSKSHVYKLLNGEVAGLSVLSHLALGRKKVVPRSAFQKWVHQNITGMIPPNSELNTVDAVHEEVHSA